MSQLPQPQTGDEFTRLLVGGLEQDQREARLKASLANPFGTLYADPQGRATFLPPDPDFFTAVGARFTSGAGDMQQLGVGKWALMSIPEMVAYGQRGDGISAPGPYINNHNQMVIDGQAREAHDVHLNDFWEHLPAPERVLLEQSGQSKESLLIRGISNGQQFAEFYPDLIETVRAQQQIQSYAEAHSLLSKAAGTTAFVGNLIDPFLIASAATGFGAPAVIGTREAAEQSTKAAVRSFARQSVRGPTDALLRDNLKRAGERSAMTRLLTVGGAGITGANFSVTSDTASQLHAMNLGFQDPEYSISVGNAALGFGLGAVLGEFAYRGVRSTIPPSGSKMMAASGHADDSLAALHHMSKETSASVQAGKTVRLPINTEDVSASDFIQDMVQNYNQVVIQDVARYLQKPSDVNVQELASFMSKMPSAKELTEALTDPSGIGPNRSTQYSNLHRRVGELIEKRDEAIRTQAGTKAIRKIQSDIASATNRMRVIEEENFVTQDTPLGRQLNDIIKFKPIETIDDLDQRAQVVNDVLDELVENNQSSLRSRNFVANWHKVSKFTGGNILLPRQRIKENIADDDLNVSIIARAGGVINSRGLDGAEVLYDKLGNEVVDAHTRILEMKRYQVVPIVQEVNNLKRQGIDIEEATLNIYKSRILGQDLDPRFTKLNELFFDRFVDDIGNRGVMSGSIREKFEDFAPMHRNTDFDRSAAKDAFVTSFIRHYSDEFSITDLDSPVNYNALHLAGFVDDVSSGYKIRNNPVTGEPYFDTLPQKLGDLDNDTGAAYEEALSASLKSDGERAFNRMFGQSGTDALEVTDAADYLVRTNSFNNRRSRRLLQQILMDDAVIDTGMFSLDIGQITHGYVKGGGYNVVRDEAVNQLFGTRVTYTDLLRALRARASGNSARTLALRDLEKLDVRESGRFVLDEQGAAFTAVASNIGAALVAGRNFVSILPMEAATGTLRAIMPKSDIIAHVNSIADSIKRLGNKEQLMNLGILRESENTSSRFVWQVNDHLPDSAARNPLVGASKHIAHAARVLFFERASTSYSKSLNYGASFFKMHHYRNKWDKLASLPSKLPEDAKELRGLARQVGIDVGEMTRLHRAGLTDPDMIAAAKRLREIDKFAMQSPERMSRVLEDAGLGDTGEELYRRLNRMASKDADDFVSTANVSDVDLTDNPIMNTITSMLSFNAHFYNSTLTRIGDSPYWKQAGMWAWLLGSEVSLSIMRDLLYNGESVETVIEKWDKEPVQNMAMAIARLPVNGPMSLLPAGIYAGVTGQPRRVFDDYTGSAALSMVGGLLDSVYSAGSDVIEEGELSPSTYRKINRYVPGMNAWMLRVLDEASTQFEEDEDK